MVSEALELGAWGVTGMTFFAVVFVVGLLIIRSGYQHEREQEERYRAMESIYEEYEKEKVVIEFIHWLEKKHDVWLARREGDAIVSRAPDARMRELVAEFMEGREERDVR